MTYAIDRSTLDPQLTAEDIELYRAVLQEAIREAGRGGSGPGYVDATVTVEAGPLPSGSGPTGDESDEIREHLRALADWAWNETVSQGAGPHLTVHGDQGRPGYEIRRSIRHVRRHALDHRSPREELTVWIVRDHSGREVESVNVWASDPPERHAGALMEAVGAALRLVGHDTWDADRSENE